MKRRIPIWAALAALVAAVAIAITTTRAVMVIKLYDTKDEDTYTLSDKVKEAMGVIDKYYVGEYDVNKVADGAVSGMIAALDDRWSYYMTEEELSAYYDATANAYQGIGIMIQKNDVGGITVTSVYDVSPAADAGIKAGSVIYNVDGTDITDYTLTEAKTIIQTALNAGQVTLGLTDPDGAELTVTLKPGEVKTDPVEYSMLEDNIAYIHIKNFEDHCAEQVKAAMEDCIAQGAASVIFDVRNDPGGQLSELLEVLDYILPAGTIFISNTKGGEPEYETSDESCVELPMAVLINSETYSAAEFFAAALEEYDWAKTVGEQTTGKGYAQITLTLTDGSAVHISAKEYQTPNGVSLAGVGIAPEFPVEISDEDFSKLYYGQLPADEDTQLQTAIDLLR